MRHISQQELTTNGEKTLDSRANHISADNHNIFCDYVLNCLDGNYKSMLEVEFKKGFLKWQSIW
jgi:hypothetical protein